MQSKEPLINVKTHPVTFGGPTNVGSVYDTFKTDIKHAFRNVIPLIGDVKLAIDIYLFHERIKPGRNDLDNFLKPVIDALDESGVFTEHQLCEIHIRRNSVKTKSEEGVKIEIK